MTLEQAQAIWSKQYKGKAAPTEHDLQVACVRWFRYRYPKAMIYAIPNGGYRTPKTAVIMKEEGQLHGVPDLHIPIPRHGFASLYIELKNGKAGRLSDWQQQTIAELQQYGNKVEVCRTLTEFEQIVTEYLK